MGRQKHLMIGCGAAALSALREIRRSGSGDEVKLVTMEGSWPYSPMSLPYLVSGRRKRQEIHTGDEAFFKSMDAQLLRGRRVTGIDPSRRCVSYQDGDLDFYDTLLIATGSEPRLQPVLARADVHGFHVMEDYERLSVLPDHCRVAILGAGFVGMELAVSFAERGASVSVIAPRERILRPYFSSGVDEILLDLFASKGIRLERNWGEVQEVSRHARSLEVTFQNGKRTVTDALIAATGVVPRTSFLEGSGILVNQGILVDRKMRTNVPGIYAAGDVTESYGFIQGASGLSPILPSAVMQGRIAGRNMCGKEEEYEGWLSMNGFNFFGCFALSMGEFMGSDGDEILVRRDRNLGSYGRVVLRNGRLIGANFFNMEVEGGVLQYLIRNRVEIGASKSGLVERPKEVGLLLMYKEERKEN